MTYSLPSNFRIQLYEDEFWEDLDELKKMQEANLRTKLVKEYARLNSLYDSCLQAESFVNVMTRFNFSDAATAGLNADIQGILSDVVSSLVAIEGIAYDMSGYTTRTEAENKINVLRDGALRALSILRDKKAQEFMNNA